MSTLTSRFYVPGGTLPGDAPSYIERDADEQLFQTLLRGELCCVLTSRQMGKSSLMVRMCTRFKTMGITAIVLDLTQVGRNLTLEQWYDALSRRIAQQLRLTAEHEAFRTANIGLAPLERWLAFLRTVLLEACVGPLILFLDEIDFVRKLPFDTDEFFAAIRACSQVQTDDFQLSRLTFCLLGVAAPSDLIHDSQMTPFNLGHAIALTDFTQDEARLLAVGLRKTDPLETEIQELDVDAAYRVMARILYWTGGHPYLTQKLCLAVDEKAAALHEDEVDRICNDIFLSRTARDREHNLAFVANTVLGSGQDVASLLTLYRRIAGGRPAPDDETSQLVRALKLSGLVKSTDGSLLIRNRIYAHQFNMSWIEARMPGQEKQRQRSAHRRGILRGVAVVSVLMALFGSLAFAAFDQHLRAVEARKLAEQKDLYVYGADMVLAQQADEHKEYGKLERLLEEHIPRTGDKKDLRGWEWGYYWRLLHQDRNTFRHKAGRLVYSVAFSPDGKTLASGDVAGTIKLWDTVSNLEIEPGMAGHGAAVYCLAFSPNNGGLLASGSADKTVRLWNMASRSAAVIKCTDEVKAIAFSFDGRLLATGCNDGTITLYDVETHPPVPYRQMNGAGVGKRDTDPVSALAFSPSGRSLLVGYGSGQLQLWAAPYTHGLTLTKPGRFHDIYSAAISPDGKTFALGCELGKTEIWDLNSRRRIRTVREHSDTINGLAYSPDGSMLAMGSWDNTITLWDAAALRHTAQPRLIHTFIGHSNRVTSVAFSPNGKTLATSANNEVKVWATKGSEQNPLVLKADTNWVEDRLHRTFVLTENHPFRHIILDFRSHELLIADLVHYQTQKLCPALPNVGTATLSPDGKTIAIGTNNGSVTLRDKETGREEAPFQAIQGQPGSNKGINRLAFSPDGKLLAASGGDPAVVALWDVASRQQIAHFEHTNGAQGIAFSRNGDTLAVANWQGLVYLWNINLHRGEVHAKDITSWRAHTRCVTDVAFSPDGRTLATGSEDNTVKLWNVTTHREMITLRGQKNIVTSVGFSPDGHALLTTGCDDRIRIYYAVLPKEADAKEPIEQTGSSRHP